MGTRRTVADLGEREIISVFQRYLKEMRQIVIPFGDDISAFHAPEGKLALLKTDMLVGKTDIPPGMTFRQASRKAVVMVVSDFAAKGVRPFAGVVSVAVPGKLTAEDIEQMAKGLGDACDEYGLYIVGGDTNEADDVVISLALYGSCDEGDVIPRSGAQPGDVLFVTGPFGLTGAGLSILLRDKIATPRARKTFLDRVYYPRARLDISPLLRQFEATSSIDSSDGLAWSLYELSHSSHVGFRVNIIPTTRDVFNFARRNKMDPYELVFHGGEEYEAVATMSPASFNQLYKTKHSVIQIGEVTEDESVIFVSKKGEHRIEPRGYEHFRH